MNLEKTLIIPKGSALVNLDTILHIKVSHFRYKLWKALFSPNIELKSGIFAVPEGINTIEEVFATIRKYGKDSETINVIYVINDKGEEVKLKAPFGDELPSRGFDVEDAGFQAPAEDG